MTPNPQMPAGAPAPMPAPMPPAGGAPAPGAPMPGDPAATADAAMGQMQAEAEAIAASAPQPTAPYTLKAIDNAVKCINDLVAKIDETQMPIEWQPPEGHEGNKWDMPLPAPVFLGMFVLFTVLEQAGFGEKYGLAVEELAQGDKGLKVASASLKAAAKDKKAIEAVQAQVVGGNTDAARDENAETADGENPSAMPPAVPGGRGYSSDEADIMAAM